MAHRWRPPQSQTPTAGRGALPATTTRPAPAVRISARYAVSGAPGIFSVNARLFPYDPAHQTFVNVYEADTLTLQAILDVAKTRLDYYSGSRQGVLAVARRFIPSGIRHIAFGPDHWLFLIGVLLLGGSPRQLGRLAGGFVAG